MLRHACAFALVLAAFAAAAPSDAALLGNHRHHHARKHHASKHHARRHHRYLFVRT